MAWVFNGYAQQSLDAKGRVTVPARWRFDGLETLLALPDDSQPALRLMPPDVLNSHLFQLEEEPSQSEDDRLAKIRYYSSRAFECPLDKQGRLLLPAPYIEKLGLSALVTMVGVLRHIEIWSPDEWESHFGHLQSAHAAGALRLSRK